MSSQLRGLPPLPRSMVAMVAWSGLFQGRDVDAVGLQGGAEQIGGQSGDG